MYSTITREIDIVTRRERKRERGRGFISHHIVSQMIGQCLILLKQVSPLLDRTSLHPHSCAVPMGVVWCRLKYSFGSHEQAVAFSFVMIEEAQ